MFMVLQRRDMVCRHTRRTRGTPMNTDSPGFIKDDDAPLRTRFSFQSPLVLVPCITRKPSYPVFQRPTRGKASHSLKFLKE